MSESEDFMDMRKTTRIKGTIKTITVQYRCQGKTIKKEIPWDEKITLSFGYEEFEARVEDCKCGRVHEIEL